MDWSCLLFLMALVAGSIASQSASKVQDEFQAFDCEHANATYQSLDLTDVEPCPNAETDYTNGTEQTIQVVHDKDSTSLTVYQCLILVDSEVQKCGARGTWDNTVYATKPIEKRSPRYLSRRDCIKAVETGVFSVDGHNFTAPPGREFNQEWYPHGGVDDNGNCEVANFVIKGKTFYRHMQRKVVHATLRKHRGKLDMTTQKVKVLDKVAEYYRGVFADGYLGVMAWETEEEYKTCADKASSSVNVTTATIRKLAGRADYQGAIVMIEGEDGRYGGFRVTGHKIVCGRRVWATNVDGTSILMLEAGEAPLDIGFDPTMDVTHVQMAASIGFLSAMTHLNQDQRFMQVATSMCTNDR